MSYLKGWLKFSTQCTALFKVKYTFKYKAVGSMAKANLNSLTHLLIQTTLTTINNARMTSAHRFSYSALARCITHFPVSNAQAMRNVE